MPIIKGEYPQARGRKMEAVATLAGPASYVQVVPGASPTGGQLVNNLQQLFGFNYVDFVDAQGDGTGTYTVNVIFIGQPAQGVNQFRLQWIVTLTGAEVAAAVNLSTFSVRLLGVGS